MQKVYHAGLGMGHTHEPCSWAVQPAQWPALWPCCPWDPYRPSSPVLSQCRIFNSCQLRRRRVLEQIPYILGWDVPKVI